MNLPLLSFILFFLMASNIFSSDEKEASLRDHVRETICSEENMEMTLKNNDFPPSYLADVLSESTTIMSPLLQGCREVCFRNENRNTPYFTGGVSRGFIQGHLGQGIGGKQLSYERGRTPSQSRGLCDKIIEDNLVVFIKGYLETKKTEAELRDPLLKTLKRKALQLKGSFQAGENTTYAGCFAYQRGREFDVLCVNIGHNYMAHFQSQSFSWKTVCGGDITAQGAIGLPHALPKDDLSQPEYEVKILRNVSKDDFFIVASNGFRGLLPQMNTELPTVDDDRFTITLANTSQFPHLSAPALCDALKDVMRTKIKRKEQSSTGKITGNDTSFLVMHLNLDDHQAKRHEGKSCSIQ